MDRRRFIRTALVGAGAVPLSGLLAACARVANSEPFSAATTPAAPTGISHATATSSRAEEPAPPAERDVRALALSAICRDAWGAAPPGLGFVGHTIDRLTVHHTAAFLGSNTAAPARLRGHQSYHLSLGWPDLAYHFAVDANGNIYEGRPPGYRGDTGTNYDPAGHFLVVAEGNFNDQQIPDAQVGSVAALLAWASEEFDAPLDTIRGHRDLASTTCPGDSFYSLIADGTLAALAAAVATPDAILTIECGSAAEQRVADIEAGVDSSGAGTFFLKNANETGQADDVVELGDPDWIPLSGNFGP